LFRDQKKVQGGRGIVPTNTQASRDGFKEGASFPLITARNLALVFEDLGKYEEAKEMNQQAMEGSKRVLG